MSRDDKLEQDRIRGEEAKQLLNNRTLRAAFDRVGDHIEKRALSTRDTDEGACSKVIQAKQIHAAIVREIEKVIQEGEVAKIQLEEIEQRRRIPFRR